MKKIAFFVIVFLLAQKTLFAQELIRYLHIEPFQPWFSKNAYPEGCNINLYLFKNRKNIDTLEYSLRPLVYNDSAFFNIDIPKEKYLAADSMLFESNYYGLYNDGSSKQAMHNFDFTNGKNKPRHVKLELKSNPTGATVYLIPRFLADLYPKLIRRKDEIFLAEYRINESTPTSTLVEEYVYIAIFKQKGKKKYEERICRPKFLKKVEIVTVDF